MKRRLKILLLIFLAAFVMVQYGFVSDFLALVPFGGELLGIIYKVFFPDSTLIQSNSWSWFLNEALDCIVISMMSSALGHFIGILLFSYDEHDSFKRKLQYFACDFLAVIASCLINHKFSNVVQNDSAFLPVWLIKILMIIVFGVVDIVIFGKGYDGVYHKKNIRAFFVEYLLKSVVQVMITTLTIVLIYLIMNIPEYTVLYVCIIFVCLGLSYMCSSLL